MVNVRQNVKLRYEREFVAVQLIPRPLLHFPHVIFCMSVTFNGKREFKQRSAYQLRMICMRDRVMCFMWSCWYSVRCEAIRPYKVGCSWSFAFTFESYALVVFLCLPWNRTDDSPRYLCNYSSWHFLICRLPLYFRHSTLPKCPIGEFPIYIHILGIYNSIYSFAVRCANGIKR